MPFSIEQEFRHRPEQQEIDIPADEGILRSEIEKIISKTDNLIGSGKTAEVRALTENPNCCLKIIAEERLEEMYETGQHPHYNDVAIEFEMLEEIGKMVKTKKNNMLVPTPYLAWKMHNDDGKKISVIVMERLPAVSLKEIYEGVPLPKNFNAREFFSILDDFLEKMHNDLGIHHRDIAEGNILVDTETGQPYLIDFGDSIKTIPDENPYNVRDNFGRVIRSYPNDRRALAGVRKRLFLKLNLT